MWDHHDRGYCNGRPVFVNKEGKYLFSDGGMMEGWGIWTLNDCKPELWSYQEVWHEQDTGLRGKLNLLLRLIHCSNGMDTLDTDMDIMATDLDTMAMAITTTTLSMYTTLEGKREMQNLQLQNVIPYYY